MTNLAGIESILKEHQARYGNHHYCPGALGRLQSKLTRAGLPLEASDLRRWSRPRAASASNTQASTLSSASRVTNR
jgi:hypothetical protein